MGSSRELRSVGDLVHGDGTAVISARPAIVRAGGRAAEAVRSYQALFIMVLLLLVLGAFLVYPAVLMLANSFNVATHIFSEPWQ